MTLSSKARLVRPLLGAKEIVGLERYVEILRGLNCGDDLVVASCIQAFRQLLGRESSQQRRECS